MAFRKRREPFMGGGIPTVRQDMFLNDPGMGGGVGWRTGRIQGPYIGTGPVRPRSIRRMLRPGRRFRGTFPGPGGTRIPITNRRTLNQLENSFTRPNVNPSLRGVRPYRGPRGIGLYKGTRTGSVNPPPRGGGNPLRRWWQNNNPWM